MEDLIAVLLSWAVHLSGFPAPPTAPRLVAQPHAFFVERACGGSPCQVWGWYAGGDEIYVDARLNPATDLLAASVVVHELTHYLQAQAGDSGLPAGSAATAPTPRPIVDCTRVVELERQAYAVQQAFLVSYGVYRPVGVSLHEVGCQQNDDR
jgi:hypothetical protein